MAITPKKTAQKIATKKVAVKKVVAKAKAVAPKKSPLTTAKPPVAKVAKSTPVVASASTTEATNPVLRRNELYERVVEQCGLKRRDVKIVTDALLGVLGEAIASGEDLQLPPLGKLKVNREKVNGKNRILICKLRQPLETPGNGPLATAAE